MRVLIALALLLCVSWSSFSQSTKSNKQTSLQPKIIRDTLGVDYFAWPVDNSVKFIAKKLIAADSCESQRFYLKKQVSIEKQKNTLADSIISVQNEKLEIRSQQLENQKQQMLNDSTSILLLKLNEEDLKKDNAQLQKKLKQKEFWGKVKNWVIVGTTTIAVVTTTILLAK